MEIEFEAGEAGYHEALELERMARFVADNAVPGSHDARLLASLREQAARHMERPEFAELRARELEPAEDRPLLRRVSALWRMLVGPRRREVALARQRSQAIERAERAERASFDTLAELEGIARQRDDALNRIAELEARVAELEGAHSK